MTERHKHEWRPHLDNPKKVVCEECDKEQYRSKLSEEQLTELKKYERPVLILKPVDLLMFVGKSFYNPNEFIEEARRMGVCKRVPVMPRGVIKNVTRVFLAHEDAVESINIPVSITYESGIFAWFTVRGISHVVGPDVNVEEALRGRGGDQYQYVEGDFGSEDERGCGNLQVGGTYLLSEKDMEECRDLAKSTGLDGHIEVIDPPIPIEQKRFRGYKAVSGDRILNELPEDSWYDEAYEANQLNKSAIAKYKRKLAKWEKAVEEDEG